MNVLDSFRLDGRLALVTGSSAGLGLAIARGLAQAGARVVLNGRDPARLAQAEAQLRGEGLDVLARGFDVTERAAVDAAEGELREQFECHLRDGALPHHIALGMLPMKT